MRLEAVYLQSLTLQDPTLALPASSPTPALMSLRLLRVLIPPSPASTLSPYVPANLQFLYVPPSFSPSNSFIPSLVPCSPNVLTNLRFFMSLPVPSLPVIRLRSRSSPVPQHPFSFPLSLPSSPSPLSPKSAWSVEAAIDIVTTRPSAVTESRTGSNRRERR